jgi:SAM-dependent methyltransferase
MTPHEEWKRLQDTSFLYRAVRMDQEESYWSQYAQNYDLRVRTVKNHANSTVETVLNLLSPSMTVLEIGAGTGLYTTALAEKVQKITVVEPSPSMLQVLSRNLQGPAEDKVCILPQRWEEIEPEQHDVVLAAGCLYVFYDIEEAVERMLKKAKKMIILVAGKELDSSGIYREAAHILGTGTPASGPDYIHLYNVLCSMGIYANVSIIKQQRHPIYDDLDHAVYIFAQRLELPSEKRTLLRDYLAKKLTLLSSGKLSFGEFNSVSAVIWFHVEV